MRRGSAVELHTYQEEDLYAVIAPDRQLGVLKTYFKAQPNNQNRLFELVDDHDSTHNLRILVGGALGGGKTKAMVGLALWFKERYAKSKIIIARKDFSDLRDTIYADFVTMCPPGWIKQPAKGLAERLEATHRVLFDNGTELLFMELKDIEGKLGLEADLIIIEQVEEIEQKVFATMEGRLRSTIHRDEDIPRVIVCGANPNPGFSKEMFYDNSLKPAHPPDMVIPEVDDPRETDEDRAYLRAIGITPPTVIDPAFLETYRHPYYHYLHLSPKHNVDLMRKNPHYVSDLAARFPKSWVQRYLDGDWNISVEGAIFMEYNSQVHDVPPFIPPDTWPRWMALDPHLAKPFAALYYAQCPDGAGFLYDELIGRPDHSTRDFLRLMLAREKRHWTPGRVGTYTRIIDYSLVTQERHKGNDGRTIKEIFAEPEFTLTFRNARKRNKWDNILLVKEQLKPSSGEPPLLYTTTNCEEARWQWKNYQWKEREAGEGQREEILKERDDLMDCAQYLVAEKPWEQAIAIGPGGVSYLPGSRETDGSGRAPLIQDEIRVDQLGKVGYGVS